MSSEVERLGALCESQDEVIGEMEERVERMVVALERAADAGLTSVTADEVRRLKQLNDEAQSALAGEQASVKSLEEERQRCATSPTDFVASSTSAISALPNSRISGTRHERPQVHLG